MPRYFFNTRLGDEVVPDTEGEILRSPDEAWEAARGLIRQLLEEQPDHPSLLSASLEVTDEEGDVVLEFPFTEALLSSSDDPQTIH
jgi:hypothetical protein